MPINTPEDAVRLANTLIDDNQLDAAALLVETALVQFPFEQQMLFYCLLCIHAIREDKATVLATLDRAQRTGVWWSPALIRADDDFGWLVPDAGFGGALDALETLYQAAQARSKPVVTDVAHGDRGRWLVHLHKKNNSTARMQRFLEETHGRLGLRIRYVQSSQVASSDGFSWDDVDQALAEVQGALDPSLGPDYVLCGTSQGGNVAFREALRSGRDFLGIMPAITDDSVGLIAATTGRFVFLVGDQDPWRKSAHAACDQLVQHGVDAKLISLGPVGHWLPDNFDDLYETALGQLKV